MNVDWRAWTPGQWVARSVIVLGALLALLARTPALGAPPVWQVVLVGLLAVGWALQPESFVGVATLLVVGFAWVSSDETSVPIAAVVAAAGMLAAHLAALLVSYGPPRLPLAPRVVRLWTIRGLALLAAAPLVWVVAEVVRTLPDSATVWLAGVTVTLSVVVVAAVATRSAQPAGGE